MGAGRWRDPDEDLPSKPLDPAEFSGSLREEMTAALAALDDARGLSR